MKINGISIKTSSINFESAEYQINDNSEIQNQDMSKSVNRLKEIVDLQDDFSEIEIENFDLKMEDVNFVWENRDKLKTAGFSEKQIKEAVEYNDVGQNITEFWEEQESVQKEQVVYSNKAANNVKNMSQSEMKDYAKKHSNQSYTSEEISEFSRQHGLNMTVQEQNMFIKQQEEKEKQEAEAQRGTKSSQSAGGYTFVPAAAFTCAITAGIANNDFNSAASDAQKDNEKNTTQINEQNSKIQETIAKTESIQKEAKQKMQKSISKSQALTAKSNNAGSKVGLTTIKALGIKVKDTSKTPDKETKKENVKEGNAEVKTETTTKENIQPTIQTQVIAPIASDSPKENATQKNNEQNTKIENAKQANEQKVHDNQKEQMKKNAKKQQKAQQVQSKTGKSQQNDEAMKIAKEAQSYTVASMNTTTTAFNKVEKNGDLIVNQNEQQVDLIQTYETRREKDSSKINKGRAEEIGAACIIGAEIAGFCVAGALEGNPFTYAEGLAYAIPLTLIATTVAIVLYKDGKDRVQEGKKGHEETYLASVNTQTRAQEVQQSAQEMKSVATEDVKQSEKIDKENAQREKQIDDILRKQQSEQTA